MSNKKALIFSAIAVVGVIATVVVSARAGAKAADILEEKEAEKGEDLTTKEKAEAVAKTYIVPAVVAGATIGAIVLSNSEHMKIEAGLTAVAAAAGAELKTHKREIERFLKKEPELKKRMTPEESHEDFFDTARYGGPDITKGEEIIDTGRGNTLFFDWYSRRWFRSSEVDIALAMYHMNRNNALGMEQTLNDWYEWLGIPGVDEGDTLGWPWEWMMEELECYWIDITFDKRFTDSGEEYYIVSFDWDPVDMNYESEWERIANEKKGDAA